MNDNPYASPETSRRFSFGELLIWPVRIVLFPSLVIAILGTTWLSVRACLWLGLPGLQLFVALFATSIALATAAFCVIAHWIDWECRVEANRE